MRVGVVLLTRDLRVHDHPALATALRDHDAVVPLFVFDEAVAGAGFRPPNRTAFLLESLADELGSSGEAFLVAYVAGFEMECKLALAVNFHHYTKGWHPTATLGVF